jgi:adenine-specific DNA-methyltransferase
MSKLNIDFLGQVFTQEQIVKNMLKLRKNKGSVLEPSCGDGAFFKNIENCIGIEFDKSICPEKAINIDFFDYDTENKFDTIIGNPPYVKYANINESTKKKLNIEFFDKKSNLYLFFIEKCIRHLNKGGELIFIVPRDFVKATSAIKLNKFIYLNGTITDWIELGDKIIFPGFNPNCVIFRFEKDNFSRITNNKLHFIEKNGQLFFLKNKNNYLFSDYFFVKVGAVSGADDLFNSENGNKEFVNSTTIKTGKTKKMHYNIEHPELIKYKEKLLQRKIKKFSEENWYEWGRSYFESSLPRIYVNSKTRQKNPFFIHECTAYDGSILAIFPKFKVYNKKHLEEICNYLNGIKWEDYGFKCGGRYLFSQKSLENTLINEKPPQKK